MAKKEKNCQLYLLNQGNYSNIVPLRITLLLSIFLLAFALLISFIQFKEILGWGDSLNSMSKEQTPFDLIREWWYEQNGRLGQALIYGFVFLPFRYISPIPEMYPWWFFRGLCLFASLTAPLFLIFANPNAFTMSKRWISFAVAAIFFWIAWSLNARVYEGSAWILLAEFASYSGSILAITVALYLLRYLYIRQASEKYLQLFVFTTTLFFSLVLEQFALAYPFLIIGTLLATNRRYSIYRFILTIFVALTLAYYLYFLSPGQQARHALIGLNSVGAISIYSVFEIFHNSVLSGYTFLFQRMVDPIGYRTGIFIKLLHFSVLIYVVRKAFFEVFNNLDPYTQSHSCWVWTLTLYVSFHACYGTLLISNYLPGYALVFPGLLLVGANFSFIISLINEFDKKLEINFWQKIIKCLLILLASIFIIYSAHSDFKKNTETNKLISENDRRRLIIYKYIILHKANNNNYVLINCPMAKDLYGWTMEPPWGLSAYFSWHGYRDIKVFLQGNYDFPVDWNDSRYNVIDCKALL